MGAGSPQGSSRRGWRGAQTPAQSSHCHGSCCLLAGLDVLARAPRESCTLKDQKLLPSVGLLGDKHHYEITAAAPLRTYHCLPCPPAGPPTHQEPGWQLPGWVWPTDAPDAPSALPVQDWKCRGSHWGALLCLHTPPSWGASSGASRPGQPHTAAVRGRAALGRVWD